MARHPPFKGSFGVTAGWQYSSGALHAATDYATPLGTPLYAVRGGVVADCNDGISNNQPGFNPGSGAVSNWILLWVHDDRKRPRTIYYQHLSPGLNVRKGQQVKAGDLLGRSGNSGNSSGPHFHVAVTEGHTLSRYRYMENGGALAVYPPAGLWEEDNMPLSDEDLDKIAVRVWNYKLEVKDSDPPKTYRASWFLTRIHDLTRDVKVTQRETVAAKKKKATTQKKSAEKKVTTPKEK